MVANEMPGLQFDRLKRAIASFVRELFPNLDYMKPHLYTVLRWNDSDQSAELTPSAVTSNMPELSKVAWRGLGEVTLPVGMEVVVFFDNADPARPFIGMVGQSSSAGSQADEIDLSPSGETTGGIAPDNARRVVRYGDTITFSAPGPGPVAAPPGSITPVSRVRA